MASRKAWLVVLVVLVVLLGLGGSSTGVRAGTAPRRTGHPGGGVALARSDTAVVVPGNIKPTRSFFNMLYQTGGTGLRNQRRGGISISGVTSPPKFVLIYWAFITTGPPGAAQASIQIQRRYPIPVSGVATIPGTVVGTGASPCWAGDTITVYRGVVDTSIVSGNGLYEVTLMSTAAGSFSGEDPWISSPLPLAEGASLIVLYPGAGTTSFYDVGLSGATFLASSGLTYTLSLPIPTSGGVVLWDDIGADGQHGNSSRLPDPGVSNETTTINGVPVAGPGSPYTDSDWNGNDSTPIPSLWDTTGHDITAAAPGGTTSLTVTFTAAPASLYTDCLTPVANVLTQ